MTDPQPAASRPPPVEKRRGPRVARSFMVRYRPVADAAGPWLVSPMKNLSAGGARFLSERQLADGTELEAQLLLPLAREPVAVTARVAWTGPAKFGMADTGVTFEAGDPARQRLLEAAVAELLRQQARTP